MAVGVNDVEYYYMIYMYQIHVFRNTWSIRDKERQHCSFPEILKRACAHEPTQHTHVYARTHTHTQIRTHACTPTLISITGLSLNQALILFTCIDSYIIFTVKPFLLIRTCAVGLAGRTYLAVSGMIGYRWSMHGKPPSPWTPESVRGLNLRLLDYRFQYEQIGPCHIQVNLIFNRKDTSFLKSGQTTQIIELNR